MTSRRRNFAILALVLGLLVLAVLLILPGSPAEKKTRLGLDLKGGVELIYEGRPTPQVPEVTPQAIDDAIETIRKRTDALGVSEPEIQRAGQNQISIGLPDVQNADRAEEQVGTTAQLQFYDWEPNVIGPNGEPGSGDPNPQGRINGLYEAAKRAANGKPQAEETDIPPDADEGLTEEQADRENDTAQDQLLPLRRRPRPAGRAGHDVQGAAAGVRGRAAAVRRAARRAQGEEEHRVPLRAAGARQRRPAPGVRGDQGPAGHRHRQGRGEHAAHRAGVARVLLRARGRLGALGVRHQEPRAEHRPEHAGAHRHDGVHGRRAAPVRERHEADRGARLGADRPARGGSHADLPAVRDHARQPDRLARDDRLPREPGGHRRPDGRADQRHRQPRGHAGPRGEPAHRRAADQPEADLEDAGLRDSR